MSTAIQKRTRDPKTLLNALADRVPHLITTDEPTLWDREAPAGAEFLCAEVLEHLRASTETYDAVYSIFGAVWFTDPAKLLPLIAERLRPGGVLAFSHPPAIPGAYGPQGMYKGGFAGKAMFTYRYSYTPRKWENLLLRAGFAEAEARILEAPTPGHIGTLIVRGRAQSEG